MFVYYVTCTLLNYQINTVSLIPSTELHTILNILLLLIYNILLYVYHIRYTSPYERHNIRFIQQCIIIQGNIPCIL